MRLPFRLNVDFGRAAFAVALAVVLYVFAVNETNPETTRPTGFQVPVEPVNVPGGLVLTDRVPTVQLRVRAAQDVFNRLQPTSFVALVDASTARAGENSLVVSVRSTDPGVRDVNAEPARVTLRFEELQERSLPVRVNVVGQVPSGYTGGQPQTEPARVTVAGPASVVQRAFEAVVDVSVDRVTVTVNGAFTPRVLDERGNELRDLTVRPPAVNVELPITQQTQYKEVGVRARTQGAPAAGYFVEPLQVNPATVTVFGDPSALEGVNFVETEPIDISGFATTVVRNVGLVPPSRTLLVQPGQRVQVTVRISPLPLTTTLRVPPSVVNLGAGVVLARQPDPVAVTISGPAPTLSNLTGRDFRVVLDASGKGPGRHELPAQVQNLPAGMSLERVEPRAVAVDLREPPATPTAAPG